MSDYETLIPQHGGYRNLKSFQIAQLIYDVTVRFCEANWIKEIALKEHGRHGHNGQNAHRQRPIQSMKSMYPELAANAVLVLIGVACAMLTRQLERQAKDFEQHGGFTERLYRVRSAKRKKQCLCPSS